MLPCSRCGRRCARTTDACRRYDRALTGTCGPFNYPQITATTSSIYVNNNVWNPVTGSRQALSVTNPADGA